MGHQSGHILGNNIHYSKHEHTKGVRGKLHLSNDLSTVRSYQIRYILINEL